MMTLMACYGGGLERATSCGYNEQYDGYNGTCCQDDHYDTANGRCCELGVAASGGCKKPDAQPYCGDAEVNGDEQCDDGNNSSQDGCSTSCEVELCRGATPAVIGNNSGDTSDGQADFEAPCGAAGTVGAGSETVLSFTPSGPGTLELSLGALQDHSIYLGYACSADQLVGSGLSPLEDVPSCAAPAEAGTSLKVPVDAQPLYIVVDAKDNASAGSFTLDLAFVDACGDGKTQAWANETCDDGNTDPGDGCSPTCAVEPAFYCDAAKEALIGSNIGDTAEGSQVVSGSACSGSEIIYRFTAAEDGTLTAILDSSADLSLAALAICDSASLSNATCVDDMHGDGPEIFAEFLTAGSTRYLVVDSSSAELSGSFDLELDFVPYQGK